MPFLPLRRLRALLAAAASLTLAASTLPAYIDHLNGEEVLEAYTLGQRHDQDLAKFLKTYEMQFPNATPGIHVNRIAIRTPYCSVVINSFERGSTFSLTRAREDYDANPYPFFAVVYVSTPFAAQLIPSDLADPKGRFWKQFDIELSQNGRIAPHDMKSQPLYSRGAGTDTSAIIGAQINLEYDVRDVASRMIRIQVTGPDTRPVTAEFDLDKLR